jgi:long-chain acyl-CoA synthetase
MIKTAAENVSATEVEYFPVRQIPEVATAAALGVPSAAWGEAVVALVELRSGSRPFDESWLRQSCRGKLAGYKIPKRFVEEPAGQWPVAETGTLVRPRLARDFTADAPGSRL